MNERSAIVAGGGLGGITAALCLAKSGCQVTILEQASEFSEVGAGIQQSPNCVRVLHHLGLEEPLREKSCVPEAREVRDWRSGKILLKYPWGETIKKATGFPYYHIHRADLLQILADAAEAEENIETRLDAEVTGLEQTDERVTVTLSDNNQISGDFLVGADGIKSTVREVLFGPEQPRYTGNTAWRGLVPADRLPEGLVRWVSSSWWGPKNHFVHYYVKNGAFINCVCVVEKTGWTIESWIEKGDRAELKSDFKGWHETIQVLIHNMDPNNCYKWALFDRDPLEQWTLGRVTLLGDACHPTLPFMAQGAAMAIEDGAVLAGCLSQSDKIEEALSHYELLRKSRTALIQSKSKENATMFHMRPPMSWIRNYRIKRRFNKDGGKLSWLYDYNALTAANH